MEVVSRSFPVPGSEVDFSVEGLAVAGEADGDFAGNSSGCNLTALKMLLFSILA